jgi:hypothetical protein
MGRKKKKAVCPALRQWQGHAAGARLHHQQILFLLFVQAAQAK